MLRKLLTIITLSVFLLCYSMVPANRSATVSLLPGPFEPALSRASLVELYPFIHFDKNQLFFPAGNESDMHFYKLLEKVIFNGNGKLNVFHIGGSHVQAGFFGNRMRENFLSMTGDIPGERGFFFPYKAANTNGPGHVFCRLTGNWEACRSALSDHSCDWGLAGIQATTKDTLADFKLWTETGRDIRYRFDRVKIFHPVSSVDLCMEPFDQGYRSIRRDSAAGYTEIQFSELRDTLHLRFSKLGDDEMSFTLQGVRFENDFPGITYNEIGVNGASVPSYLRSPHFERHLAVQPADLVIFGIGINDAHKDTDEFNKEVFKENYRALIARFKRVNPKVNFIFITNNDSYFNRKPNKNAITVRQAMLELAEENRCAVWDFFEIMGGLGSVAVWQKAGLAKKDKIHFTTQGYHLMGDLLFDAIQRDFAAYLQRMYSFTHTTGEHD